MEKSSGDVYERALGRDFGRVFNGVRSSWAWAVVRRNEYNALYSNIEYLEVMNRLAGNFFGVMQRLLWDDLLLCVTRLTDPPKSAGRENLSVAQLLNFCKDPKLSNKVKGRVKKAQKEAMFARDWRNRRISHTDLDRIVGIDPEPLAEATLDMVTAALDSVLDVLNVISRRLMDTEIMNVVSNEPSAVSFLVHTRQLVNSVLFVDNLIDPEGNAKPTNAELAKEFLRKLDQSPDHLRKVFDLRVEARRLKRSRS